MLSFSIGGIGITAPFHYCGHSQGTNHAERLLKEVILVDEKMFYQLKLAYLLGMPITIISDVFYLVKMKAKSIVLFLGVVLGRAFILQTILEIL